MGEHRTNASVVVAVYNSEETLETYVRSLLNLEYPTERELVFVANESTDRSLGILNSFGSKIRILHEPRRRASAARNRGIREARFPVVAFTDSDCTADPHWLRHLVAPLSDPDVGASGRTILGKHGSWASRKGVREKLNGFDETFLRSQDVEFSCRLLQAGFELAYAPGAIVYHRNERTNQDLFHEGFTYGGL